METERGPFAKLDATLAGDGKLKRAARCRAAPLGKRRSAGRLVQRSSSQKYSPGKAERDGASHEQSAYGKQGNKYGLDHFGFHSPASFCASGICAKDASSSIGMPHVTKKAGADRKPPRHVVSPVEIFGGHTPEGLTATILNSANLLRVGAIRKLMAD